MSDTPIDPESRLSGPETAVTLDPDGAEPARRVEVSRTEAVVRRAPRYGRFLLVGAIVGTLVALVLTFAFPENEDFDRGQVFGFLLLGIGAVGVALGAAVALLIDRVSARRAAAVTVEHESAAPPDAPATE